MGLPNVNVGFAAGSQLGGTAITGVDSIFAIIAPATVAPPNKVTVCVDPSQITTQCGYGYGPELIGQCLAAGGGTAYLIPGNPSVVNDTNYTYGVSPTITQSRSSAPTMANVALLGVPSTPVFSTFSNTGTGVVTFDKNSFPQVSTTVDLVSVTVTTLGPLGAAIGTIVVGTNTYTGVLLTQAPWAQPGAVVTNSVTYGSGTVVVTGSGPSATFTFTPGSGPSWSVNAYVGDLFVDKNGASWVITSNSSTVLTGSGAPASGTNATSSINSSIAGSNVILDFAGTFALSDYFSVEPTPADDYNVVVIVNGVNSFGQALYQYSLDNGVTYSGTLAANLGGVINVSTGAPAVSWATGSTFPTQTESVALLCTQAGTLTGLAWQCSVASGLMTTVTPSTGSATITAVMGTTPGVAGLTTVTLAIGSSGTGTAAGAITVASATTQTVPAQLANPGSGAGSMDTFTLTSGNWSGSYTPVAGDFAVDQAGTWYVATTGSMANTFVATTSMTAATTLTPLNHVGITKPLGTASATLTLVDSVNGTRIYTLPYLPATFTETTTGIAFAFSSGSHNFVDSAVYTETIQPPALFTKTVILPAVPSTTVTTGVNLPSSGQLSFSGPILQFPLVQAQGAVWAVNQTYSFWAYAQATTQPGAARGYQLPLAGLQFSFGFGTYANGDTYSFPCKGPYLAAADAENALGVITSSLAYNFPYAMVGLYTGARSSSGGALPQTWAATATLASAVNTQLLAIVPTPTFLYKRAIICGPSVGSTGTGAAPTDYITATGALALDRVAVGCGADFITSVITGRQDLRNHGVADICRLANPTLCPPQTDPGEFNQGSLQNVVSTLTSLSDATVYNANRGMVATTFEGVAGVYEAEGLTLSTAGGDYSTIMNCRVIDKAAYYGRQALLPYGVNRRVPTVKGGTLAPTFANAAGLDVQGKITQNCGGNFQSVTVTFSLTDVLVPSGTENVQINVTPWGYIRSINATIGFVVG